MEVGIRCVDHGTRLRFSPKEIICSQDDNEQRKGPFNLIIPHLSQAQGTESPQQLLLMVPNLYSEKSKIRVSF